MHLFCSEVLKGRQASPDQAVAVARHDPERAH